MEKRGKPTVTLCTNLFEGLARISSESEGIKGLPLVVIPHPVGGLPAEEVREKASHTVDNVINRLLGK